ncbi:MAG: Serine/threonine-protein kinase PknD [Planctomycetes bacterium]|nr:Serine/threonine-protein kinase PknD [Planctomycetota bacterium]
MTDAAPEPRPETLLNIPVVGDTPALEIKDSQGGATLLELGAGSESVLSRVHKTTGANLGTQPLELKSADMRDATTQSGASTRQASTSGFTERVRTGNIVKYLPERELGRGGMGVVLSVRDNDLRREVAMKVVRSDRVRPGTESGDLALRRFVEEAQITGQLEHPNIVPVHELGADANGRIFFTMKLVHGKPLSQIIRELRLGDPATEAEYPLDRLLQVFMKVCDAIGFAHAHNVVHRDLKPDNIMIGRFGEVLVMDWGLARLLDHPEHGAEPTGIETDSRAESDSGRRTGPSVHSMEGTIAGTPAYMAPEQARGEISRIDQRTDIFALGAILYEILVLRPPYTAEGGTQIIEQAARGQMLTPFERVAEDEQLRARLSRLPGGRIPPELAAIAMHALAKQREDRYPTARALKEDVENYIAGRPVSVHRDILTVRMAKWVRRHPTLSISSAAAAAVLLVAVATIMFIVAQARQQAVQQQQLLVAASQEAEQEADKRAKAETELKDAALQREAALKRRTEATALYRAGAEQAARARQMAAGKVREGARESAESALRKAVQTDDSYVDPVFALAQLLHFFGDRQALEFYERTSRLTAAGPSRGDPRALVYAGNFVRDVLGDLDGAAEYYRQAGELDANNPHVLVAKGMLALLKGEMQQALEFAQQARAKDDSLWEPWYLEGYVLGCQMTPDDRAVNPLHDAARAEELFTTALARSNREAEIYTERGSVRFSLNRYRDAELDLRRAIELAPGNHTAKLNLSAVLRTLARHEEAIALTSAATEAAPESWHAWAAHGLCLYAADRDEEALKAIQHSLELQPDRPAAYNNLAHISLSLGRYADAQKHAEKALELEPRYHLAWLLLAHAHEDRRRFDDALAATDRAIEIAPEDGVAHATRARVLLRVGRLDEAFESATRGFECVPPSPFAAQVLGLVEHERGNYARAVELQSQSLELFPDDWQGLQNLATSLQMLGRYSEALEHARRVVELQPQRAAGHFRAGTILLLMDNPAAAIEYFRKANEVEPGHVDSWVNRASAANELGLRPEARDASRKVTELSPENVLGWVNLGRAELALGEREAAGIAADKADALPAPDAFTKSVASDLLHEIGRDADALKAAQAAIKLDENAPDGWRAMSRALYGLGRTQDALTAASKYVELAPRSLQGLNFVATLLVELGRFAEAEEAAKRTLEVDPANALALKTLGNARSNQGQHRLAIESYEAALRVDRTDAYTWLNLGVCWLLLGDYDRCIPGFKEATVQDPQLAPAWEYWGTALQAQGRSAEAIEKLLEALKLNPNSAGAHSNIASAYYDTGKKQLAAEHAGKAVALNPRNPNAWYRKGISHFDLGEWQLAAEAFEQVAKLAPQNQYMPYMVAQCRAELAEYEAAKEWANKALGLDAKLSAARVILARAELGLGNKEEALKQLKQALEDQVDPNWALQQSWWDDIKEEEAFVALLKQYLG